jgi:hypothetical protein
MTALPSVRDFEASAELFIRWAETWLSTPTTVESLGKALRQSLLEGRCDYEDVLEWAKAGDPVAHSGLILTYDRLADLRQHNAVPQRVEVYCRDALRGTMQPKPKPKPGQRRRRGQGRHKVFGNGLAVTNLVRDLGLVTVIRLVVTDTGLERTRSEGAPWPSAASVLADVLTRQGKIEISESRLNDLCTRWGSTVDTLACAWYLRMRFPPGHQ